MAFESHSGVTAYGSRFKASYQSTLDLLQRELEHLGARQAVIQLDLREQDIRLDGLPRAGAKPASPGVIVSFESRHGPLRYMTDVFQGWKSNLRAIALGLEALRKVDRYGISKRGEQYTGWRQLEAGGEEISRQEDARRFLLREMGVSEDFDLVNADHIRMAYRQLAKRMHPDTGGDPEQFKKLQRARDLLLGREDRL